MRMDKIGSDRIGQDMKKEERRGRGSDTEGVGRDGRGRFSF